jgi:hypothetical protein
MYSNTRRGYPTISPTSSKSHALVVPLNPLLSGLVSELRFLAHNGNLKMLAEFSSSDVLISIALLLNHLYYSHCWDAPEVTLLFTTSPLFIIAYKYVMRLNIKRGES